jgi:hypothetical protein
MRDGPNCCIPDLFSSSRHIFVSFSCMKIPLSLLSPVSPLILQTLYPTPEPVTIKQRPCAMLPSNLVSSCSFVMCPPQDLLFSKYSLPTSQPSSRPTHHPTSEPSRYPTPIPSFNPTNEYYEDIIGQGFWPTRYPTISPSRKPTISPSFAPSITYKPTTEPTLAPTPGPPDLEILLFNSSGGLVQYEVDGDNIRYTYAVSPYFCDLMRLTLRCLDPRGCRGLSPMLTVSQASMYPSLFKYSFGLIFDPATDPSYAHEGLATTYFYDPTTGRWQTHCPLTLSFFYHSLTLAPCLPCPVAVRYCSFRFLRGDLCSSECVRVAGWLELHSEQWLSVGDLENHFV